MAGSGTTDWIESTGIELRHLVGADAPILDAIGETVLVAAGEGTVLYVNGALHRLLGWRPDEIVGRPITSIVPERHRAAHQAGFAQFLDAGDWTRHPSMRVPALAADGSEHAVELTISALTAVGGRPYLVATLHDLGDRVELERESALAQDLLDALAAGGGGGELLERVLAALGDALQARMTCAWLPQGGRGELECVGQWLDAAIEGDRNELGRRLSLRHPGGLPGAVWATGAPKWLVELDGESGISPALIELIELSSGFAFPIRSHSATLGVIEVYLPEGERSPALLESVVTVGRRLGDYLERSWIEDARHRLAEHERAIAATLQASLLPTAMPQARGLEFGGAFHPGGELVVGGDFFDVFPIRSEPAAPEAPRAWGLVIGDVCGTGPEAAALTANVRYTARAIATLGGLPAHVLRLVNQSLLEREGPDRDRFCTCCVAVLAPGTRGGVSVWLASAGHPPPLRRRLDRSVERIAARGRLLGVFPDPAAEDIRLELEPGEVLVFYTDGVIEARRRGEQFGIERLMDVVRKLGRNSAQVIADKIEAAAREFAGGEVGDDLAVLAVQVADDRSARSC